MSVNNYKTKTKGTLWEYAYIDKNKKMHRRKGFTTKKEAKKAEADDRNLGVFSINMTFEQLYGEYLKFLELHRAESSYRNAEYSWRTQIQNNFPNRKLNRYTRRDIRNLRDVLKQNGLTNNNINKTVKIIHACFNYGIEQEYTLINPCQNIKRLEEPKVESSFWTYPEFLKAIETEKDITYITLFYFMYFVGTRLGETRALRWSDFNFDQNTVFIGKHAVKTTGDITYKIVQGTKNKKSYYAQLLPVVKDRLLQLKEYEKTVSGYEEDSYVFGILAPLPIQTIRNHLNAMSKNANIKKIKIHGLRHSCVSFLYNDTHLTERQIADWIDDTLEVVLRTYAHIFKKIDKDDLNSISKIIDSIQQTYQKEKENK